MVIENRAYKQIIACPTVLQGVSGKKNAFFFEQAWNDRTNNKILEQSCYVGVTGRKKLFCEKAADEKRILFCGPGVFHVSHGAGEKAPTARSIAADSASLRACLERFANESSKQS
ncbi:hypothetical protein [Desulfovibrio sp. ZJ369]|uniref:hypothetical protein n=1 Tax=Desulfovibrio sp. ZJ369 TaxID=2709793 RepID=UPI0013EBECB4|nr:hypothetical protein [Desulfovibrio sp. ZJ369]